MHTTFKHQDVRPWVACAMLAAILIAPRHGHGQDPVTVTDCNVQDWVLQTLPVGSTITFLPGPASPPLGQGSVELYTPQGNVRFRNTAYHHIPLSALTELGYASYILSRSNTTDDLYIVLQIDFTGDEVMDEVILFNPRYQTAQWLPPTLPVQEDVEEGVWQEWDALHGAWWLGPSIDPENGGPLFSIADYISAHPTARIINPGANGMGGIRFQAGGPVGIYGPNFRGNIDEVRIGVDGITTRYDLEYSIADAGPDQQVTLGYGSNCTLLQGTGHGGVPPYTYLWSPGGSDPDAAITEICPTQTYAYQLTVTDANGCTGTDEVTVSVEDVRCGPALANVLICHEGETLCVSSQAVPAHLAHADALGSCSLPAMAAPPILNIETAVQSSAEVCLFPNPANGSITLQYQVPQTADVLFELWNAAGQRMITRQEVIHSPGLQHKAMDIHSLANGAYYWKLTVMTSEKSWAESGKMIVLH